MTGDDAIEIATFLRKQLIDHCTKVHPEKFNGPGDQPEEHQDTRARRDT